MKQKSDDAKLEIQRIHIISLALKNGKKVLLVVVNDDEGLNKYEGRIAEINEVEQVIKFTYDSGTRWFYLKDIIDVDIV